MGLRLRVPQRAMADLEVLVGGAQTSLKGEDTFSILEEAKVGGDSCTFFAVADGHGGKAASAHITAILLSWIVEHAKDGSTAALNEAVVAGFAEMHRQVSTLKTTAGSTLTVCCLNATRREASSWNVGDSLALLAHDDGYMELGTTHRLEDNPYEQQRVIAAGAKLGRAANPDGVPGGPVRAYPGGLAVTRCIGDADCSHFVSPEPAFTTYRVPPAGGALVACSDGVWDHLNGEDVAMCLLAGEYDGATSAATKLVQLATAHGITDDTTALCMLFGPPLDAELDDAAAADGLAGTGRQVFFFLGRSSTRRHRSCGTKP